jgi:hypothetical protein
MRGIWVRYRDGSTDEWEVKEAMRLAELTDLLRLAFHNSRRIALAVASAEGNPRLTSTSSDSTWPTSFRGG